MQDPAPEPPPDLDGYDSADLLELAACYDGDDPICRVAFKAFYDRHAPRLGRTVARFVNLLGSAREVKDLVEETFGEAYRKAHTFQKKPDDSPAAVERNVAAWLHRIARNLAIGHGRREIPTTEYDEFRPGPGALTSVEAGDDAPVHATPKAALIQRCLDALPAKQRDALLLAYNFVDPAAGNSRLPNGALAKIAEMIGTTKINVPQLRYRAEQALRACCDGATSP